MLNLNRSYGLNIQEEMLMFYVKRTVQHTAGVYLEKEDPVSFGFCLISDIILILPPSIPCSACCHCTHAHTPSKWLGTAKIVT